MHHELFYGKTKSVIWLSFQGSSHKEAIQTFHCFVLTVFFFFHRLNENIFFLFVSSTFYSLRFRHFGRRFSFRTVDLSRESLVLPPTQQFLRTRIKITFRGRCQLRKLKSAKNKLHVFLDKTAKIWRRGNFPLYGSMRLTSCTSHFVAMKRQFFFFEVSRTIPKRHLWKSRHFCSVTSEITSCFDFNGHQMTSMKIILKLLSIVFTKFYLLYSFIII